MQARFQHTRWPSLDQFRYGIGILERNFFTVRRLFFLYLGVPLLFLTWITTLVVAPMIFPYSTP